jgi:multicomponent Na+:H+ antiporter subunit A
VLAFILFLIPKKVSKYTALFIAFIQLGVFALFFNNLSIIEAEKSITTTLEWIPILDMNIEFTLDGLSLFFSLLITFIGFLVFIYAHTYMKSYSNTKRFYFYLTLFSGAMLGIVLSANFIQFFIFWELTSVLSYLLISFFNEKENSRKAAFQSLFVTGFGGLCLLASFILIGSIVDSYSLSVWLEKAQIIKNDSRYLPALILMLIGAFSKSAQFPFHFWLLGAMQAPTPVSSYLHSATMVKAGVFLLARLYPVLGGTAEWTNIVSVIGALTMLVGAYLAITQINIKTILAYTTISALGILTLLLGMNTKLAAKAAFVFLFVHAFYKAALFMLAGYIIKQTGTKTIEGSGGLIKATPIGFVIAMAALFSMSGLPPLLGFIGKELIYEAKFESSWISTLLLTLGVVTNIFMIAVSFLLLFKVFLGKSKKNPSLPNAHYGKLLIGPGILSLLSLLFGLFPDLLSRLLEPVMKTVLAVDFPVELKLWHGFNQVLLLSILTILMGIFLFIMTYKNKQIISVWQRINDRIFAVNFNKVFADGVDNFIGFSRRNIRFVQHGYIRYYIITIIVITTFFLILQLFLTKGWEINLSFTLQPFYISGLVLVIVLSAVFSIISMNRVFTLAAMGVTGYGIALIYVYYSAIDLAITQIIIETLMVVMFVLTLGKLPKFKRLSGRSTKIRDALIALSFGGVMTFLALNAIDVNLNPAISEYFVDNSALKAYGKNVVNVILVDFRALDTLGEITVLVIAAMGVYSLLNVKRLKK